MSFTTSIRKRLFSVDKSNATFAKRGFVCNDPEIRDHLENIGFTFLDGYHLTLSSDSFDELKQKLDNIDKFYRGFAYEGAAMAITIIDWISISKKRLFDEFLGGIGAEHNYMSYVGAGWALARLPVNVSKRLNRYDPLLKYLVLDGYGFHEAYFNTKKTVDQTYIPELNGYESCAYAQGIGRALWFVCGTDPDRIHASIQKFPEVYRPDLWSGIGLAATYAGGASKSNISYLMELAKDYRLHIMQGVCFAAKAREKAGLTLETNEAVCHQITKLNISKAASIADETLVDMPVVNSIVRPSFEIWRSRIRYRMSEIHTTQLTKENLNEKAFY